VRADHHRAQLPASGQPRWRPHHAGELMSCAGQGRDTASSCDG
jgi:hypothetical protein